MKTTSFSLLIAAVVVSCLMTIVDASANVYGVTRNGRAYAAGPRGAAVAGPNGVAVARRGYGGYGGHGGYATTMPRGYVRVVPGGYRVVHYGGYNCRYVGGVYYRPVVYGGDTVYVIVR